MKTRDNSGFGIVYSSEHGRMCPKCGKPAAQCTCKTKQGVGKTKHTSGNAKQPVRKNDGIVRVSRETKGRKGKGVTIITGLPLTMDGLRDAAKQLKQKCGSGGTVKEGVIEIQGDHRDAVVEELTKQGYTVKKSGG